VLKARPSIRKILKKKTESKAKWTKNWKRTRRKIGFEIRADGRRGKTSGGNDWVI
jgi:hypothetical protein